LEVGGGAGVLAPATRASSLWALTIATAVPGLIPHSSRVAARPSSPGIIRSIRTTDGSSSTTRAQPSAAEDAVATPPSSSTTCRPASPTTFPVSLEHSTFQFEQADLRRNRLETAGCQSPQHGPCSMPLESPSLRCAAVGSAPHGSRNHPHRPPAQTPVGGTPFAHSPGHRIGDGPRSGGLP
jgi:hypothetical protein